MDAQFFWGIIAGAVIVLAAFLIPMILQLKRTAKAAEEFFQTTQSSLNPLLKQLQDTLERTNVVAEKMDESMSRIHHLTKSVGDTGAIIDEINTMIRQVSSLICGMMSGLGAGIKTALSVLTQGIIKKEVEK